MEIAFYAPLKPPGHPVPSGDRTMARNLITAISRGGRAKVRVASDLRLRDGSGDPRRQDRLRAAAADETARLIRDLPDATRAWVTYHNYYKAPDLIGPAVARARNLPYVLIEASRAKKRLNGPWAGFARAAEKASDAADAILYATDQDREALERDRPDGQILAHLPPFLPLETLPDPACPVAGRLVAAGMMRPGDKLASYRLLSDALAHLDRADWTLDIAGDGPARVAVENLFHRFGDRVRFLGQLDSTAMAQAYGVAYALVWPGVNEAFGMIYLEAQAAGVPVVAQNRPGVRDVVAERTLPRVSSGATGLARRMAEFLDDDAAHAAAAEHARQFIARGHLLPAASDRIWSVLGRLTGAEQ
ncbi:MAG: glycosyltransferase family 4 protein [Marinibacterium sp.]